MKIRSLLASFLLIVIPFSLEANPPLLIGANQQIQVWTHSTFSPTRGGQVRSYQPQTFRIILNSFEVRFSGAIHYAFPTPPQNLEGQVHFRGVRSRPSLDDLVIEIDLATPHPAAFRGKINTFKSTKSTCISETSFSLESRKPIAYSHATIVYRDIDTTVCRTDFKRLMEEVLCPQFGIPREVYRHFLSHYRHKKASITTYGTFRF
jgi:hypothetical protein